MIPGFTRIPRKKTIFKRTCNRSRGENETTVIHDITQFIVPSAEILTDRTGRHLKILRETTNAGWTNAIPFYGPRIQGKHSICSLSSAMK
jgi:hypothetical protein